MTSDEFIQSAQRLLADKGRFVLWRQPGSVRIQYMFPRSEDVIIDKDLSYSGAGFICHPFDHRSSRRSVSFESPVRSIIIEPQPVTNQNFSVNTEASTTMETHTERVKKVVDQIRSGHLNKAVISQKMELSGSIDPMDVFLKANATYPDEFVYLFSSPETGTWLGASPEQLLTVNHSSAEIDSLAGTRLITDNVRKWSSKEIEEQQIVTDRIISVLLQFGIQANWSDLEEKSAGKLLHLHRKASFDLREDQIGALLSELHPTPAVCGEPKKEALHVIRELEDHDREYYCGAIGPLRIDGQTNIYVNLRCMQLFDDRAVLYTGGGITLDSDPLAEWEETQHKCQTMLQLLG